MSAENARFEIFQGEGGARLVAGSGRPVEEIEGEWYWRLVGGNNKIQAQSEGYTRKADAERGASEARTAAISVDMLDGSIRFVQADA